jgi:PAS domain S-box-containing protein
MPLKHLVFPSAGSLSVAVVAAFIFILQIWFSTKRAEFRWWRWTAAVSFSTIIYAVGILLEYNAPEGPINRFGGLLEWTAIIFLVHALYGFVFSRLNIPSRRYHLAAGGLHVLILILLWSTNIFVSDHFIARRFLTLEKPFVEADLGPLGPAFMLYALGASINAIRLWIVKGKEKETHSRAYVWGASFWILLGAHDAACAIGFLSFQYVMEYGFLFFSAALLYTMFSDYLRTSDALDRSNAMLEKELEMRKGLEEALRKSEQQHRNLIENINDVIYAIDLDGNVTYISPVVKSVMGYTPSELVGRHFSEFIHNKDLPLVMKRFEETLSGHLKPWEYRLLSKSGEYRWVRSSSRPIIEDNRVTGLQGVFIDITARKRAEEALRQSERELSIAKRSLEERLQVLLSPGKEPSDLKITEILAFQTLKEINEAFARVFDVTMLLTDTEGNYITGPNNLTEFCQLVRGTEKGLERCKNSDEMLAKWAKDAKGPVITRCSNAGLVDAVVPVRIGGRHVASWLVGQWCPPEVDEGKVRLTALKIGEDEEKLVAAYHELKRRPIEQLEKTLELLGIFAQELSEYGMNNLKLAKAVTERKQAEEALQESERRYRTIVNNTKEGIILQDASGRILTWNQTAERVFGVSEEDALKHTSTSRDWNAIREDGSPFPGSDHPSMYTLSTGRSCENVVMGVKSALGGVTWININTNPLFRGNDSNPNAVVITFSDITERKRAEEATKASEIRYRELFDNISSGVAIYEARDDGNDFIIKDYNRAGEMISKVNRENIVGRSVLEVFPGIKKFGLFEVFQRAWKTGKPEYHPVSLYQDDNLSHWADNYVYKLPSGEIVAVFDDVTERKQAEEAVRISEERFRQLAENVNDIFWVRDVNTSEMLYLSPAFEKIFGISCGAVYENPFSFIDAVEPDDIPKIRSAHQKQMKEGKETVTEYRINRPDGEIRWIRARTSPVFDKDGVLIRTVGVANDITESKKAEEALREKSLQVQRLADELELIIDGIPGRIFFKDTENRFIRVNKFVADAHQMTKKQLEGTSAFELYPREMAQAYFEDDLEVIRSRRPKLNIGEKWETEYGTRWVNTSKIPYLNENGEVTGVIGLSLDITERKKAEEALRESEEKYRSLVESTVDSIYLVDRERRYLYTNKNYMQHFSLEINKVIGRSYDELHSKDETKEFKRNLNSVIETGKSYRYAYQSERDGRHYLRTLSPVRDLEGNIAAVTVVSKDITELIRAEEDLRQANEELSREHNQRKILSKRLIDLLEKDRRQIAMELHDHIGQILASLKMDIEMLHRKLMPEQRELGGRIAAVQERTIQAIKDVKNISRGLRPGMLDALGLVPSLRGLFNEIQRQTDIEIHFFSRNVPKRFAPEKELAFFRIAQESMNNIVKYARAKEVFVNLVKKDEEVSLSIEDDGIGFDPKRVTQTAGEGLPLGLLIMQERAEQLEGDFTLESQAGKGTHLLVEIPL